MTSDLTDTSSALHLANRIVGAITDETEDQKLINGLGGPGDYLELAQCYKAIVTALEPFANAGRLLPAEQYVEGRLLAPDATPAITVGNHPGPYQTLTYADLRKAARVMGYIK